jgi:hypothetical protein
MKIFLIALSVLFSLNCYAQEEKSPIVQFLIKRGYVFPDSVNQEERSVLTQWPGRLYYNTTYKSFLLGSPTIPISFSRLERIDGKYQLSPTISIGYGYTWFFGKFIFNENDKITVDPTFFFGTIADVALQSDFTFKKLAGIFAGGFIGFGGFSFFGGYDFIVGSPTFGVGGRVDLYTIYPKSLKPIGKVYEVRKPKRSSPEIEYE